MELFQQIIEVLDYYVWSFGIPVGDQSIPLLVIALVGTGVFLTLRYGFIQIRHFWHGAAVATGRYDDPSEPGDVSHFQALTTALSATVGIGNIAGVALAIHWGGPGALVWMWLTAFLGMATKFAEVTLAQKYRDVEERDADKPEWEGTVAGGPMYYIERGLGDNWKWMAALFAVLLGTAAFMGGNAIQANTLADTVHARFGVPDWIVGLTTAGIVALVILGGIRRIGRVTSRLVPLMAAVYVLGALTVILANYDELLPSFALIFSEALDPSAGVAGVGVGAFLVTLMWGVRQGLFSNEAGQGSAPIAHAAAQTDEPVSEGVVALLAPFIDTLVICTMTGLVIIMTGVWDTRVPTEITLPGGDISYVMQEAGGNFVEVDAPERIPVRNGLPAVDPHDDPVLAWHEVAVERFYVDAEQSVPFSGAIYPERGLAVSATGERYTSLYADAVENGAPLTMLGFARGLERTVGWEWGGWIVLVAVLLFAISTAISWSYYGDRCAFYLFGEASVLPYKIVFVVMHFIGAVLPLTAVWNIGTVFLGIAVLPNLLALVLLSGTVDKLRKSYFAREPWHENRRAHLRWKEAQKHANAVQGR